MSRMVSVWLPALPIERLKRMRNGTPFPVDRPFALVGSEDRGLLLTALNAAALGEGLSPGLGLADARAICPQLLTAPAAPDKDAACLLALARWSGRYSLSLNVDGDDGLWLDVSGVPHLFGGARSLLADMAQHFARLGFSARLALAETLGGAHGLARYAHSSSIIVPQRKMAEVLAPLPVEALRLDSEITRLLKRLGLKRIGQLYDLPRTSLERRFHSREAAEAVLHRLDQALGRRDEPHNPLLPTPNYAARLPFPEPLITHEGIVAGLDHLAEKLCEALALARRGARRLHLTLYRADGTSALIEAGLSAPCHEPSHLARLFEDRVCAIDVGFGVDLMVLAALATEALLPAQALEMRSALAGPAAWSEQGPAKPPRPCLLFAEPEPVDVLAEIPEGPPARFTWRRVTRRVVKAEGPERIAPEWWREFVRSSGSRPRDYYRIEDEDGRRYWVFRAGLYQESEAKDLPAWFLHGVFG